MALFLSQSTAKISVRYPVIGLGPLIHIPKNPSKLVKQPIALCILLVGKKKPKQLYISPNYSYPFIYVFPEAGISEVVPVMVHIFQ